MSKGVRVVFFSIVSTLTSLSAFPDLCLSYKQEVWAKALESYMPIILAIHGPLDTIVTTYSVSDVKNLSYYFCTLLCY